MNPENKKAFMLLKSVIFHYHGLDEAEQKILQTTAEQLHAHTELAWANSFIAEDYLTAFDRARSYLQKIIESTSRQTRLDYLKKVWEDNQKKGYISEMEATAMLKLAADWQVERELVEFVKR